MFLRRSLRIFVQRNQLHLKSPLTTSRNTVSFVHQRHGTLDSGNNHDSELQPLKLQVAGIVDQVIPPNIQENPKIVTVDDWRSNRESFTNARIFRLVLSELSRRNLYDAGKSFIEMIKKYEPQMLSPYNEISILRFLSHFHNGFGFCSNEDDIQYIQDTYTKIRKAVPLLEIGSLEVLMLAIVKTPRWSDGLEILRELSTQAEIHCRAYRFGPFIYNALKENNSPLAWSLIDQMIDLYLCPQDECWIEWLHYCRRSSITEWEAGVGRMLDVFYSHHIQMSCAVADELIAFINDLYPEYSVETVLIDKYSLCSGCTTKLHTEFSSAEHAALKEMVEKIIKSQSLFASTTPAEMQRFINFIENCPPYNVVIDGLNAHYLRKNKPWTNILFLKSVLGARMLFLGRAHVLKKKTFREAAGDSPVFICDDLSRDDVYVLYAAVYHNELVKFVSQDQMRPQFACLADDNRRNLFLRWQYLNQINAREMVIRSYLPEVHKTTEETYHIPCVAESPSSLLWRPAKAEYWLCVRRKPRSKLEKCTETRLSEEKTTPIKPKTTTVATNSDGTTIVDDHVERLNPLTSSASDLVHPKGSTQKNLSPKMNELPHEYLIHHRVKQLRRKTHGEQNSPTLLLNVLNEEGADSEDVRNNVKKKFNKMFDSERNNSGSQKGSRTTNKEK